MTEEKEAHPVQWSNFWPFTFSLFSLYFVAHSFFVEEEIQSYINLLLAMSFAILGELIAIGNHLVEKDSSDG